MKQRNVSHMANKEDDLAFFTLSCQKAMQPILMRITKAEMEQTLKQIKMAESVGLAFVQLFCNHLQSG